MKKERIALWFDEDEILKVFERPRIKKQSDEIFKNMNFLIRFKMDHVFDDIYSKNDFFNITLSREEIVNQFKKNFYIQTFKKAIMHFISDVACNDDIILSLLTEDSLIYAIYGDPMKQAFLKIINCIPVGSGGESCLLGKVADTVKDAFKDF